MRRIPFRLVDVFAARPLAGNQLCVVPEAASLDETTMQALATEIGFSEITFVNQSGGQRYSMRIFTPVEELPFAGHPTLGTAYVLVAEGRVTSPAVQTTRAGQVTVEVDVPRHVARMRQLTPTWEPELLDRDAVVAAVGLGAADLHPDFLPQVISTGLPHLIVPAAGTEVVGRARPDADRLKALLQRVGAAGLYLFALDSGGAKARMFYPGTRAAEDPATGSAAGPLGVYLALRGTGGAPVTLTIRQGEEVGRPSVLHVEVSHEDDTWQVTVGGGVFIVGDGAFTLA
ncbi:MAG: PhzF family phenazine biosynthesis protein [Armatimonadota bacterium]|nr:PhzF family phenazine biosynthesis protein [Armatimonadota bacterium]